jgi:hypothetical protein
VKNEWNCISIAPISNNKRIYTRYAQHNYSRKLTPLKIWYPRWLIYALSVKGLVHVNISDADAKA